MSAATTAQARIPRLKTLGSSYTYQSATTKRKAQPAPAPRVQAERPKCCDEPNVGTDEEGAICYNCGHVFQESAIVSEVTFGETAGGAAMVEGGFIGENQRHANSMGGTMRGLGGMGSREHAEMNGKSEIQKLGHALNVSERIQNQAIGWYKLAMGHSFVQGRRIRNVAAVAIYMAARRQPENTLMLMDLAEKVQVNVWALGDTYKSFLKMLREEDPAQLIGNKAVQEIEPLMLKYCRKLEFNEASHKVADDACKLLKRMSRDWMVQGRQPAGLCGACIILAARMNNFRRTVREVVYVVKVADSTVNHRLYEFKATPSSALTVNQFREFGQRLKVKTLPPAIWRREKKEKNKERRQRRSAAGLTAEELENSDGEVVEQASNGETGANPNTTPRAPTRTSERRKSNQGTAQTTTSQPASPGTQDTDTQDLGAEALTAETGAELDSLGSALALNSLTAAVDTADTDDVDDETFVMPKKRGRPPKVREVVPVSEEDLEIEHEIESEITHAIKDWEAIFKKFADNDDHELLKNTGLVAANMAQAWMPKNNVNLDPDIGDDEFEDDPDVATCILAPHEVRIKERIWITQNEDWLRDQQQKMLAAELELALDKPKKQKQKRKHTQMGDGSVLGGEPAASAADAAHKMLQKRAKTFSNAINYDRLKDIFPGAQPVSTPSGSGQGASPAASQVTPAATVVQGVDEDAEGEEEEYYEEAHEEEEFDDPAQYGEDDEGFGNDYEEEY
ncbi:BRF1-domain-containing protein [Dothidotthia symphoricarpi CBS 119687]|uniref:BRF1-domain-containing protein n=1 Tax=Dothidotthia symphoricarpi CBS 119687 TaxID=1392245 RepID=A0A6A6AN68_9PLEO|nr:BRF1-domain-containing protein [Dothidotthia symphoricarpi CBS 119687]KAF2133230.1 BRF1-domain-containing protein [Dothidotthia symphoricarpi CBS 119687]